VRGDEPYVAVLQLSYSSPTAPMSGVDIALLALDHPAILRAVRDITTIVLGSSDWPLARLNSSASTLRAMQRVPPDA
jgi:hypothetical protein